MLLARPARSIALRLGASASQVALRARRDDDDALRDSACGLRAA
ncbi:MAG: hypothetical protein ABSC95_06420 [Acetobacteraceae bacterium]|jgi:hypothetical protein